jgi:hypothetical protein
MLDRVFDDVMTLDLPCILSQRIRQNKNDFMRISVHSDGFPPFVPGKRKLRSAAFTTKLLKFDEEAGSQESRVGGNRYLQNASTCRPSRRRTIQNSSTVSKVSESEVAAAAPWPPKRGTSATQSATFITNASA